MNEYPSDQGFAPPEPQSEADLAADFAEGYNPAVGDTIRKTPLEVDVEMLTAEQQELLRLIHEAGDTGPEADRLSKELAAINHSLVSAQADLFDQRRNQGS